MRATELRKQSLYGAFGDKKSLFLQSLRLYRAQVLAEIHDMLSKPASPLEGIERVLRYATQPPTMKNCPSGCLMANTALELGLGDRDVADEVKKMFCAFERALETAVKRGQQKGEITSRFDSTSIAQTLANTVNGIRILEKTGASHRQVRNVVDTVLAAIRR